jgi:hypothetical protein
VSRNAQGRVNARWPFFEVAFYDRIAEINPPMRSRFLFATFFFAPRFPSRPFHALLPSSGKHPFIFDDMMALKRVAGPVPSPDGKWVLFAAKDVNLDENTKKSHLWIVPADGGSAPVKSFA